MTAACMVSGARGFRGFLSKIGGARASCAPLDPPLMVSWSVARCNIGVVDMVQAYSLLNSELLLSTFIILSDYVVHMTAA